MIIVGSTRWCEAGALTVKQYANGQLALLVNGHPLTVNLPASPPPPGTVWIKDWSENEGVYDALVSSGVIEPTEVTMPTGFVEARLGRLTPAAVAEINSQVRL